METLKTWSTEQEGHKKKTPSLNEMKKSWTFSLKEDGTYLISGYKGPETNLVIPSAIKSVRVTEVGKGKSDFKENLFFGELTQRIRSVTLQEGIELAGRYLFLRCESLRSAVFPASVKKIGYAAFFGCSSLESVTLPEGVEEIEANVFERCTALKTVVIPSSVKKMGGMIFYGCPSVTVYCESEKKPSGWEDTWDEFDVEGGKVRVVWGHQRP